MRFIAVKTYLIIIIILIPYLTSFSQNKINEGNFQTDNISTVCEYYRYVDFQIDHKFTWWQSQYK